VGARLALIDESGERPRPCRRAPGIRKRRRLPAPQAGGGLQQGRQLDGVLRKIAQTRIERRAAGEAGQATVQDRLDVLSAVHPGLSARGAPCTRASALSARCCITLTAPSDPCVNCETSAFVPPS